MSSGLGPTLAQKQSAGHIGVDLCAAIRALRRAGYSTGETAFMLERDQKTVIRHGHGSCGCESAIDPAEDRR